MTQKPSGLRGFEYARQLVDGLVAAHLSRPPVKDMPTKGEVDEQREKVRQNALAHPLVTRYLNERQAAERHGRPYRNTEPWTAIGERGLAALLLAWADSGIERNRTTFALNEIWPMAGVCAGYLALLAVPYLWKWEVDDLALGAPLPRHKIADDVLPHPVMFWSFETARTEQSYDMDWMLVASGARAIFCCWDITPSDGDGAREQHIGGVIIPYRRVWPDDVDPPVARDPVGTVLKRCAFVKAPFVDATPIRLRRATQRELARKNTAEEDVSVVRLRRYVSAQSEKDGDSQQADWKHQWWVGGHYRAQWYPSLQAHKVIYIAPHLKGPPDKPLLEKTYAVVR